MMSATLGRLVPVISINVHHQLVNDTQKGQPVSWSGSGMPCRSSLPLLRNHRGAAATAFRPKAQTEHYSIAALTASTVSSSSSSGMPLSTTQDSHSEGYNHSRVLAQGSDLVLLSYLNEVVLHSFVVPGASSNKILLTSLQQIR